MKISILRFLPGMWPPHAATGVLESSKGYKIMMDDRMFFWVTDPRGSLRCYPVHVLDSWDPVLDDGQQVSDLVHPANAPSKRGPGRPPKQPEAA